MSRKKKFIPEVNQEVECFCCDSNRETPWLYPFSGYCIDVNKVDTKRADT